MRQAVLANSPVTGFTCEIYRGREGHDQNEQADWRFDKQHPQPDSPPKCTHGLYQSQAVELSPVCETDPGAGRCLEQLDMLGLRAQPDGMLPRIKLDVTMCTVTTLACRSLVVRC